MSTDSATAAPPCRGNRNICLVFHEELCQTLSFQEQQQQSRLHCKKDVLLGKQIPAAVSSKHPRFIHAHTETCPHKGLRFFNSRCAPNRNSSKCISDSPFESPPFFWRSSWTNSTGMLFYCTKETEAVRGNVPDHFKAGLLLLDDFYPLQTTGEGKDEWKRTIQQRSQLRQTIGENI